MSNTILTVTNRNGGSEKFNLSKIQQRLEALAALNIEIDESTNSPPIDTDAVNISDLVTKICNKLSNGIKTSSIDDITAAKCSELINFHPEYDRMAARIVVSNMHKEISTDVKEWANRMYRHRSKNDRHFPRISRGTFRFATHHAARLNAIIKPNRDYLYDYFGIMTECRQYLLKVCDPELDERKPVKVAEIAQFRHLMVAINGEIDLRKFKNDQISVDISEEQWDNIKKAYDLMSTFKFTHATPTRLNAGAIRQQMVSCNLDQVPDNAPGIMSAARRAALMSKDGAGLGYSITDVRCNKSPIFGTGGESQGTIRFIKIFNEAMVAFNQGGGNRKGSLKFTMEVWHADILTFIDLRLPTGEDANRARDIFLDVYFCDEFERRLRENQMWYLMDPAECPGLTSTWGDQFTELYNKYVRENKYIIAIPAQELALKIGANMLLCGQPFNTFKDTINRRSNQQGWATIKCLNLCLEVALASGYIKPRAFPDDLKKYLCNPNLPIYDSVEEIQEVANCNLASISIKEYATPDGYDFEGLSKLSAFITRRLDNIIDFNNYPLKIARETNARHRPIGIGIQGLQDLFYIKKLAWGDKSAIELDQQIMEAIYYGALSESTRLAKIKGAYPTYQRSPAAFGFLQPDLYLLDEEVKSGKLPDLPIWDLLLKGYTLPKFDHSKSRFDWGTLRAHIAKFGLRNSELTAPMPTASTSQILGNTEAFEVSFANLFERRTLSGTFTVINKYLVKDLEEAKLWSNDMRNVLIANNGSIENIPGIPPRMVQIYRDVWSVKQKDTIEHTVARGQYTSMSQSHNKYAKNKKAVDIVKLHEYAHRKGMKATYYTRSFVDIKAQDFEVREDQASDSLNNIANKLKTHASNIDVTSKYNPPQNDFSDQICLMCGS